MSEHAQTITRDILQSGLDDWVYFADVAGIVRQHCKGASHEHTLSLSLDVLQEMFDHGLLVPGEIDRSNSQGAFVAWTTPQEQWYDELKQRLLQCQNNPGIGDVCWFANTPKGDAEARAGSTT